MPLLLRCEKIMKRFGGLEALKGVDLDIDEGLIVGLIGPNGSGKTTLINCIAGFYSPTSGRIFFDGRDITGLKNYQICKLGIARTFQIPRPFPSLTVLQNVMVATVDKSYAIECLRVTGLFDKRDVLARDLTAHQMRMLELARALATNPKILMLDEVMAGLNPVEIENTIQVIKELRGKGLTILWVEHVMRAIMKAADYIYVLHEGLKIAEGKPIEVANDEKVIKAYLGEKYIL
ncbi:MAG: ABC transporter ATP-binding protein [Candidatus Methanomethylicia archaeon]